MIKRLVIAPVLFYKRFVSAPLHAIAGPMAGCRFTPSCSTYFIEAVQTHGAVKGAAMGIWRILRCNPFCRGGIDNVPKRGAFRKMTAERITYRGRDKELKNENSDKN